MPTDKGKCIAGAAIITFGGTDLGLTTDEGFEEVPEMSTITLDGAQSLGTIDAFRTHVEMTGKCTIKQISLENLHLAFDLKEVPSNGILNLKFQNKVTKRALVVTGPGPDDGTRTETYTAGVKSVSGYKRGLQYAEVEIEFFLFWDPVAESYGTVVDSPGSTLAPAASSYQWIASNGAETTFTTGATTVANTAKSLQVTFNVAIRPDQLGNHRFALKEIGGSGSVPCTYAYGKTTGETDFTKVKLTPTSALSATTDYELIVMPGTLSNDGVGSTDLAAVQFTTT